LGTASFLEGSEITQVIENKVVGDTGFEPVTSTYVGGHSRSERAENKRFPLLERDLPLNLTRGDSLLYNPYRWDEAKSVP